MTHRIAAIVLMTLSLPPEAYAFECSRTDENKDDPALSTGPALSWQKRSISYTMHEDGTTTIGGSNEFTELRAAFDPWEQALGCDQAAGSGDTTDLALQWDGTLSTTDVVGFDFLRFDENQNLLIFLDQEWPYPPEANLVIALTTVTYSKQTGQILNADIEFNSAQVDFCIKTNDPTSCGPGEHDLSGPATPAPAYLPKLIPF